MWDFSDTPSEDMNLKEEEEKHVLSVSEAIIVIKENITRIPLLTVVGEVSGFRGPNARSGHCYFDIKDASASMAAIVWKGIYLASGVTLHDGMRVQITGRYDVYKGSGKLSFVATSLTVAGEGDLRQKVAELAKKLEREGLMREDRKRPISRFCTRIGVVTSLSGSVIEDVKRTLARRNPLVEIEVTGAAVQGEHAPQTIVQALGVAESTHPDAILLVRGGGSFEDLMCFNDETVARAIAASSVPIITGIGHEPDVTIADMVSDRRTSTPTAAAESVAPSISELQMAFNDRVSRLAGATEALLLGYAQEIDGFSRRADLAIQNSLRQR
ncbi:MAG: exodeoxyribonuclease VII large subunit, partial [Lancefieldella rimae]|nr:exodeoxyribonuclease VII large subunit [Lancefieldella rimae]